MNMNSAEIESPQSHADPKQHDSIGTPPKRCEVPRVAPSDANINVGDLNIRLAEVGGTCLVEFDSGSTTSTVEGGEGPCAWVRWQAPVPKDAGRFNVLGGAGDPMAFELAGRTYLTLLGGGEACPDPEHRCGSWSRVVYVDDRGVSLGNTLGSGETCIDAYVETTYL